MNELDPEPKKTSKQKLWILPYISKHEVPTNYSTQIFGKKKDTITQIIHASQHKT